MSYLTFPSRQTNETAASATTEAKSVTVSNVLSLLFPALAPLNMLHNLQLHIIIFISFIVSSVGIAY